MSQVASVGLPMGARDVWEELGSRAEVRYTWDLTRNTNLEWAGKWKPRCRSVVTCYTTRIFFIIFLSSVSGVTTDILFVCIRFDRVYLRPSDSRNCVAEQFGLVGLNKVEATQSFPSDHWGVRIGLKLCHQ